MISYLAAAGLIGFAGFTGFTARGYWTMAPGLDCIRKN